MKKDKTKALFLEQLQRTPIIQAACDKIDIARWTVYRWKKEDPEFTKAFNSAMREGKELVNDVAISQLLNSIKAGNLGAVKFWLQNCHIDFANKIQLDGKIDIAKGFSPEQKDLIRKAMKLASFIQPNLNEHDKK